MPPMPIYEYRSTKESGCEHCLAGFARLEKLSEPPASTCPRCDGPIQRVISAPHVQRGQAHLLSPKKAAEAGFTQYKKIGQGVYEKTAGRGPRIIGDE